MYEASIKRKTITEEFLKSMGVLVNPHLPRIEDASDVKMREASEVARRSIVLYCIVAVGFGEESEGVVSWLRDQDLWDFVSPDEKAFLTNENPTEQQRVEASWRVESLWTLLWSTGKVDSLEFPTTICDVNKVQDLMPIPGSDCGSFFADVTLRSLTEVLDQVDLIYRIHWAVRESELKGDAIPCSLVPGVVYERHYSLNWLVRYAKEWDDVTTDT